MILQLPAPIHYLNVIHSSKMLASQIQHEDDMPGSTADVGKSPAAPKFRYGSESIVIFWKARCFMNDLDNDSLSLLDVADVLIRCLLDEEETDSPSPSPHPTRQSARLRERYQPPSPAKVGCPMVILALDEAHSLTDVVDPQESWTAFSELRRALRSLNEYRLFSLFLSTTGKMSQFTSAKKDDSSTRVQLGELILIMPFTDLGFDQLASKIASDGSFFLEDVASIEHMVTLGRPM